MHVQLEAAHALVQLVHHREVLIAVRGDSATPISAGLLYELWVNTHGALRIGTSPASSYWSASALRVHSSACAAGTTTRNSSITTATRLIGRRA